MHKALRLNHASGALTLQKGKWCSGFFPPNRVDILHIDFNILTTVKDHS